MEEPPRPAPAPAPDPDALLRRWRDAGDAAALGALFDATAPELFSVALHLCRDPALAEDALQETFLAALRHLDRFEADRRVVPWLAGILRNKVHEVRRFGARAPDPRRLPLPPDPEGPLAAAATAEEEARVRAALEDLEEPYREVAILRWRHGLEPAEIAAAKRMAPGTVRSLLHRAAGRLKRDLVGLPVLLLLLREGPAAPRGLAAVRAEVIRRAPAPVLPAAAGAGSTLLLGGALVAHKTVVAAAAILLLAGAGWFLLRGGEGDSSPTPPRAAAAAAPAPAHPAGAPPATGAAGTAVPAAPLPIEGPRISGRILDREGRPVAGARVACYPDTLAKVLLPADLGAPGASAVAAADGRFEVAASPDAPFHTVLASAPGFSEGFLSPVRAGAAVDLVLDRPCALAGRVTDMDGNPVPGARVRVLHLVDVLRIEREALAGADGNYRVEGLLPRTALPRPLLGGQALVEVTAAGFAPLLLERGIRGDTLPGTTGTLDAVLARGSSVAGRVLDADTGEGIAGARVVLWSIEGMMSFRRADGSHVASPWGPRPLQEVLSGEGGAFRFDGVPCAGAHPSTSHNMGTDGTMTTALVGAWKDGFCGTSVEIPLVAEGKVTERELRLPPAAAVRGRVVDGAGKPLAGIHVWTTREGAPRMGWFPPFYEGVPLSTGTTKEDGTYRIAGLPAKRDAASEFTVGASTVGRGENAISSTGTVVVSAGAAEEAAAPDIVIGTSEAETARAVVVATDESGAPIWGASVGEAHGFGGGVLRTDAAGRAVFSVPLFFTGRAGEKIPRPTQETALVVKSPGFGPATVTVTPAAADPPEVRVVLTAAHRLSGRVVEADGSPARGATVIVANGGAAVADVFPEGGPRAQPRPGPGAPALLFLGNATTDTEGRFTVEDLPAGPWHVQAYRYLKVYGGGPSAGGFAGGPRVLQAVTPGVPSGAGNLLLTLPADDSPPTGLVEGSVRDAATGRPVWNFQAWLVRGPESVAGGTPSGGKFRIEGVPEGTWTLRVTAPGYAEWTLPDLAVAAGAEPRLAEVALARGTTVVGRVRDASGGSLEDLKATFASAPRADGGISYAAGVVGKDGAFRVQGLTGGTWTLSVSGGGFGPNQRVFVPLEGGEVGIAEGTGEVRLEVVVAAGGILTVGVRDPRFPPNAMEGGRATEEQAALGAASRIEIRDGAGRVVREQTGVTQPYPGPLGHEVLLPGDYEVRLLTPGGEPRVERVRIEAGKRATVTFRGE